MYNEPSKPGFIKMEDPINQKESISIQRVNMYNEPSKSDFIRQFNWMENSFNVKREKTD